MVFWSLRVNIPWINCQLWAFIFLFLTVNMYISCYLWIIQLIITMVWLSIKCQSHTTLDSINTACSKLKLCLGICADMVCYKINICPCLHFRRQLSFNLCRLSCFCRQSCLLYISYFYNVKLLLNWMITLHIRFVVWYFDTWLTDGECLIVRPHGNDHVMYR